MAHSRCAETRSYGNEAWWVSSGILFPEEIGMPIQRLKVADAKQLRNAGKTSAQILCAETPPTPRSPSRGW
jgi:hypothetical protein